MLHVWVQRHGKSLSLHNRTHMGARRDSRGSARIILLALCLTCCGMSRYRAFSGVEAAPPLTAASQFVSALVKGGSIAADNLQEAAAGNELQTSLSTTQLPIIQPGVAGICPYTVYLHEIHQIKQVSYSFMVPIHEHMNSHIGKVKHMPFTQFSFNNTRASV